VPAVATQGLGMVNREFAAGERPAAVLAVGLPQDEFAELGKRIGDFLAGFAGSAPRNAVERRLRRVDSLSTIDCLSQAISLTERA
jgi:hypothetical protein